MTTCRKCQSEVEDDVTVCPACGHLVGVPFLSIGIDDALEDPQRPESVSFSRKEDFGDDDALIVGKLGGDFTSFHGNSERFAPVADPEDFLTATTGDIERPVSPVPIYVDMDTAGMLRDEAVLRLVDGAAIAERTPIEQYVAGFLDGRRPVARVAKKAGLAEDDLRIALALLADGRLIHLAGVVRVPGVEVEPAAVSPRHDEEKSETTQVDAVAPAAVPDAFVLELPSDALTPLPPPEPAPPPIPAATKPSLVRPPMGGAKASTAERRTKAAAPSRSAPPPSTAQGATKEVPLEQISGAGVVILPSDPKDVKLYKHACMKEHEGDYDTALRLLRHALMLNPKAALLHNRLGVILATRLGEYKAATDALFTAVSLEPDNATYKSNLAKVMEAAPDDTLSFGVLDEAKRRERPGLAEALKKRLF